MNTKYPKKLKKDGSAQIHKYLNALTTIFNENRPLVVRGVGEKCATSLAVQKKRKTWEMHFLKIDKNQGWGGAIQRPMTALLF